MLQPSSDIAHPHTTLKGPTEPVGKGMDDEEEEMEEEGKRRM